MAQLQIADVPIAVLAQTYCCSVDNLQKEEPFQSQSEKSVWGSNGIVNRFGVGVNGDHKNGIVLAVVASR